MIYVTSDWHGYDFDRVQALFKKANFSENDFCFVLGDVIDRGLYGVKLLLWLMEQPNIELILGNHEAMFLACDFMFRGDMEEAISAMNSYERDLWHLWRQNGASTTVHSLLNTDRESIGCILDYLRDAPLYDTVTVGDRDFLLVHSGLGGFRKDKKMREYIPDELYWHRPEIDERYFDDVTTVFGHTPTLFYGEEHRGKALFTDTWIDVDTGAACAETPMLLRLDDLTEFYLDETEGGFS
ncbi:MAG: metallophosphoesterase [Bacillota bacterium]